MSSPVLSVSGGQDPGKDRARVGHQPVREGRRDCQHRGQAGAVGRLPGQGRQALRQDEKLGRGAGRLPRRGAVQVGDGPLRQRRRGGGGHGHGGAGQGGPRGRGEGLERAGRLRPGQPADGRQEHPPGVQRAGQGHGGLWPRLALHQGARPEPRQAGQGHPQAQEEGPGGRHCRGRHGRALLI